MTKKPGRPPAVRSLSLPTVSPEIIAKKLRTLYFRGFPLENRDTILAWLQQQDLPDHEEIYTIGNPTDTAAVLFQNESALWVFLRKCPNNRWKQYKDSQIFVGLDNLRGQNPEKNKAIRKLYRACILILTEKLPEADVLPNIYRNYNRGFISTN